MDDGSALNFPLTRMLTEETASRSQPRATKAEVLVRTKLDAFWLATFEPSPTETRVIVPG